MIIEQFLSGFHSGDAVGNSVMRLHTYLRLKKIESRIIAITIDDELDHLATQFDNYKYNPESVKIYHFAIASPLSKFFRESGGKKIMIYHNVTPAGFFSGWSTQLEDSAKTGRLELRMLSDSFDLAIADSTFNQKELIENGYGKTSVFPVMIDLDLYKREINPIFLEALDRGEKRVLFVGRISPNKKIEDLIRFRAYFKENSSLNTRLIIAGNYNGVPSYFTHLINLAESLGMNSDDIFFTGHIPFDELLTLYKSSDLFLSMSEHEGFCLPLVESMATGLPVVAFDAGAVAETLDGAGITFNEKKWDKILKLTEDVLNNSEMKMKLKDKMRINVNKYRDASDPGKFFKCISELYK